MTVREESDRETKQCHQHVVDDAIEECATRGRGGRHAL